MTLDDILSQLTSFDSSRIYAGLDNVDTAKTDLARYNTLMSNRPVNNGPLSTPEEAAAYQAWQNEVTTLEGKLGNNPQVTAYAGNGTNDTTREVNNRVMFADEAYKPQFMRDASGNVSATMTNPNGDNLDWINVNYTDQNGQLVPTSINSMGRDQSSASWWANSVASLLALYGAASIAAGGLGLTSGTTAATEAGIVAGDNLMANGVAYGAAEGAGAGAASAAAAGAQSYPVNTSTNMTTTDLSGAPASGSVSQDLLNNYTTNPTGSMTTPYASGPGGNVAGQMAAAAGTPLSTGAQIATGTFAGSAPGYPGMVTDPSLTMGMPVIQGSGSVPGTTASTTVVPTTAAPSSGGSLLDQVTNGLGNAGIGDWLAALGSVIQGDQNRRTGQEIIDYANNINRPQLNTARDLWTQSLTDPNAYFNTPEFQSSWNTTYNNLSRQDAAAGRIGSPANRTTQMADYTMKNLQGYRGGLADVMNASGSNAMRGMDAYAMGTQMANNQWNGLLSGLGNLFGG